MMLGGRTIGLIGLAWALAFAVTARAQGVDTLQEAIDHVQRENGGKILSAETVNIGRGKVYRVKVLTPGGQVRTQQVTANAAPAPAARKRKPQPQPAPRAPEPRARPAIEAQPADSPESSHE